jgi:flagellar motor component MotA
MKRWDYSPRTWEDQSAPKIDSGMAYGLAGALGLVGLAVVSTGSILQFLSPVGILFVFGGSIAATMVQAGPAGIADAWRAFLEALFYSSDNASDRIRQLVDCGWVLSWSSMGEAERICDGY